GTAAAAHRRPQSRADGQRQDRRRDQADLPVGQFPGDQEGSDQRAVLAEQRPHARRARARGKRSADEEGDGREDVADVEVEGSHRLSRGAAQMTALLLAAAIAFAQGLEPRLESAAPAAGVAWVGYRVPMIAGNRRVCCDGCRLERLDGNVTTTNQGRVVLE